MRAVAFSILSMLLMLLVLAGCGLRPLYAGGVKGSVAALLADVQIAPIKGHSGWLVRNALRDRLVAVQGGNGNGAGYRLDVRLEDSITGFGVRADDSVTRERRRLRARYQLVDVTSGDIVFDASATSDAGIDVAGSEYATIAAEKSALERLAQAIADQIVSRLAIYASRSEPKPEPVAR